MFANFSPPTRCKGQQISIGGAEIRQSSRRLSLHDFLSDVEDKYERDYDIASVDFHENYNVGPYLNNDLALVRTEGGDMDFNEHVSAICLPPDNYIYREEEKQSC